MPVANGAPSSVAVTLSSVRSVALKSIVTSLWNDALSGRPVLEKEQPNVTANGARPKWAVDPDVPLPTPWDKEEFEKHSREVQAERARIRAANQPESVMDKLFTDEREWETKFLGSQKYAGKAGAFEGAAYEPRGLYRPQTDCIMFTRDEVGFCRVCRAAIERIIGMYSQ